MNETPTPAEQPASPPPGPPPGPPGGQADSAAQPSPPTGRPAQPPKQKRGGFLSRLPGWVPTALVFGVGGFLIGLAVGSGAASDTKTITATPNAAQTQTAQTQTAQTQTQATTQTQTDQATTGQTTQQNWPPQDANVGGRIIRTWSGAGNSDIGGVTITRQSILSWLNEQEGSDFSIAFGDQALVSSTAAAGSTTLCPGTLQGGRVSAASRWQVNLSIDESQGDRCP